MCFRFLFYDFFLPTLDHVPWQFHASLTDPHFRASFLLASKHVITMILCIFFFRVRWCFWSFVCWISITFVLNTCCIGISVLSIISPLFIGVVADVVLLLWLFYVCTYAFVCYMLMLLLRTCLNVRQVLWKIFIPLQFELENCKRCSRKTLAKWSGFIK